MLRGSQSITCFSGKTEALEGKVRKAQQGHEVSFWRLYPSTAFQALLLTMMTTPLSKGFLATVVDIMVIWIKFTHSGPFSLLIAKMSMFTLAISCLTTSNLPWFLALAFQIPMQYCSLQHQTWLPSPVTSTTGCCFCFGSVFSVFLELFLHCSPVSYWAPTSLRSSSFSVLSFCLFILFMGFSRQEYWRQKQGGCNGAEAWLRGATPRPRSGAVVEKSYLISKVRSSGCALLEQLWRDTPRPR